MATIRPPNRTGEEPFLYQTIAALGFSNRNHFGFHAKIFCARGHQLEKIHFAFVGGQHQTAVCV